VLRSRSLSIGHLRAIDITNTLHQKGAELCDLDMNFALQEAEVLKMMNRSKLTVCFDYLEYSSWRTMSLADG
jgi:hypothetical protein